jgi:hypothetical protein
MKPYIPPFIQIPILFLPTNHQPQSKLRKTRHPESVPVRFRVGWHIPEKLLFAETPSKALSGLLKGH